MVLAIISVGFNKVRGDIIKYMNDTKMLMATITSKFFNPSFKSVALLVPNPKPIPKIGPISGDMSIAPIITGIEFTLRPTEAIIIEKARIHTLGPLKYMLLFIFSAAVVVSMWSDILAISFKNLYRIISLNL